MNQHVVGRRGYFTMIVRIQSNDGTKRITVQSTDTLRSLLLEVS